MENVSYNKKSVDFPTCWNDLTPEQFLFITDKFSTLLTLNKIDESDYYASRVEILKHFLNMPLKTAAIVTADQWASLLPFLEFLESTQPIDLDKQLLPKFKIRFKSFFGPMAKLETSSVYEFATADSLFIKSNKDKDLDILYKLVATLYRPKQRFIWLKNFFNKWDGDIRVKYSDKTLTNRTAYFKKHLDKKYVWAVLYFYWGFRNKNIISFKNLFPPPDPEAETKIEKTGNDYGWGGTLLEFSGNKFGDFEKTKDVNWHTFLIEMSRQLDINNAKKTTP